MPTLTLGFLPIKHVELRPNLNTISIWDDDPITYPFGLDHAINEGAREASTWNYIN